MKEISNNKRNEKGITLVALVVTIVVLLILAGVSIVTLFGESGIITAAQKAADATKNSIKNDLEDLKGLEGMLNGWKEVKNKKGQVIAVEKDGQELKIGDYVVYDCKSGEGANASYISYSYENRAKNNGITSGYSGDQIFRTKDYNGSWRVLGVNEKGELLIMATNNVSCIRDEKTQNSYFVGANGVKTVEHVKVIFQHIVTELNNISEIYGKGNGAIGARSITVEDINKITGYDPTRTGNIDNNPYGKGAIGEYGNKIIYYWDGTDYPYYEYITKGGEKRTGKLEGVNGRHSFFRWWENGDMKVSNKPTDLATQITEVEQMIKINENPIENSYYFYYPETLTENKDDTATIGIENKSQERDMLFGNSSKEWYWLASSCISSDNQAIRHRLRQVYNGGCGYGLTLFSSNIDHAINGGGIRPVVTLETGVKLLGTGEDLGTESNPYKLSK